MPTKTFVLAVGNNDLNAAGYPKGVSNIVAIQLNGGAAAATINIYDSAVSPPAITHAATVALAQGAKERDFGFFRYRPTPVAETGVPEFDPSVVLVPPGAVPTEPTGATSTDASNYVSSTGVFQRNEYPGSRQTSTVVNANAATVPSKGTFSVGINGIAKWDTALSFFRGLVVNSDAITTLIVTYN